MSGKGIKQCACTSERRLLPRLQENAIVIDWVNRQPLAEVLTCLGDGHDGIWNIISQFAPNTQRREVLDWFHLIENVAFGEWFPQAVETGRRLALARTGGGSKSAIRAPVSDKLAQNFCQYLDKHRHRIINYQYYQTEQICEGSFRCSGVNAQAD